MKTYGPGLLLLLLAAATPAIAQQTAARAGTAVASGENPYIRLQDKEGGQTLTMVSFWKVAWSPVGAGTICYVTVGEKGAPGQVRIALYDSQKLYDYMNEVLAVSDKTMIDRPFTPVANATFETKGDDVHERSTTCRGGSHSVQLAWHDLQPPQLMDSLPGGGNAYGITYLRSIAKTAEVTINGQRAPGTAYGRAALAFAETWLKK